MKVLKDWEKEEFFEKRENKIILSLLYHKTLGSSSFYYPYISTLPKIFRYERCTISI